MVLTIKLKNKEDYKKLDKFLKENSIEVIDETLNNSDSIIGDLKATFSRYKINLPKDFKFNREEANER